MTSSGMTRERHGKRWTSVICSVRAAVQDVRRLTAVDDEPYFSFRQKLRNIKNLREKGRSSVGDLKVQVNNHIFHL